MLANFVQETANAPGTAATINLGGAAAGRLPFIPTFASGTVVFYGMDDGTLAEMGIGTVTAGSPNTLARTTVLWNSAGTTARMNFLGSVRVYNAVPAERGIYLRSDGTVQNATATGSALFRAADAAAARAAIGATATGSAVLTAVDAAAARAAIGAANAGGQTFSGAVATSAGDITAQAGSLRSQISGAATTGQVVLGNGSSRLYFDGTRFDLNGPLDVNGDLRFNAGYGSIALAYGCRAWVNFNGVGGASIRASGNVSSVVRNGTGEYTINFAAAMPDANYAAIVSLGYSGGNPFDRKTNIDAVSYSASSVRVRTGFNLINSEDQSIVNVAIFR